MVDLKTLTTIKELPSVLGRISFVRMSIPNLATYSDRTFHLTPKDIAKQRKVGSHQGPEQDKAFVKVKELMP